MLSKRKNIFKQPALNSPTVWHLFFNLYNLTVNDNCIFSLWSRPLKSFYENKQWFNIRSIISFKVLKEDMYDLSKEYKCPSCGAGLILIHLHKNGNVTTASMNTKRINLTYPTMRNFSMRKCRNWIHIFATAVEPNWLLTIPPQPPFVFTAKVPQSSNQDFPGDSDPEM